MNLLNSKQIWLKSLCMKSDRHTHRGQTHTQNGGKKGNICTWLFLKELPPSDLGRPWSRIKSWEVEKKRKMIVSIVVCVYVCVWKNSESNLQRDKSLTSMLTGSIVLIWTFGAEEDRSRWPNWFRWSSSLDRKLGGMGMDLDGDRVEWQIDLQSNIKWMKMCSNESDWNI